VIAPELEHLAVDITTLDELPGNPRKGDVDANLAPGDGNDRQIRSQRVDSQIVTPDELHVLDAQREIVDSSGRRLTVRERQVSL